MAAPPANQETRYAVVTGGGSGIGREICRLLSHRGWLVAVADIDEPAARETVEACGGGLVIGMDVADQEAWEPMLVDLQSQWPRLDLLVNNAGLLHGGDLADAAPADIRRLIDVNLLGTALGCRAATPWLVRSARRDRPTNSLSPRSGVINTASIFAPLAPPGFAIYSATKAAVVALSESLRGELAAEGLNVTVTLPGAVPTGLFERATFTNPAHRRAADQFAGAAGLTTGVVAEQTLRAAAKGKPLTVIGRRAGRFAWLKRWAPGLARRLVRSRAHQVLGAENEAETSSKTEEV